MEGMMFAQKRVQTFEPASGKPTVNKITKSFEDFIRNSFNEDGSYRTESEFPALAGKNNKNCKWKVHLRMILINAQKRIDTKYEKVNFNNTHSYSYG